MKFIDYITGGMGVDQFAAAFVFTLVGVALSLFFDASRRNPVSVESPIEWSWNYFWNDNIKRILKAIFTGILVIFVSLRFTKELFGREISMFFAFVIGLSLDQIQVIIRKAKYKSLKN